MTIKILLKIKLNIYFFQNLIIFHFKPLCQVTIQNINKNQMAPNKIEADVTMKIKFPKLHLNF